MKRSVKYIALACSLLLACGGFYLAYVRGQADKRRSAAIFVMDTVVDQTVYGPRAEDAMESASRALYEMENRLSLYKEGSEIAAINAAAGSGAPVPVSQATLDLLAKTKDLAAQTDGAFELTIAPLALTWGITSDAPRVPSEDELQALLPLVNDDDLLLADGTARLAQPGQAIDLGGIAKGEACQVVKQVYDEYNIQAALCSLGGSSIYARGTKPDGSGWRVGFRDPKAGATASIASFELKDAAFCTSGGYERFFEQDGVRYHHILDPATGRPAESDIVSVGVLHADGAAADLWSTALFVWGKERALAYFAQGGEGLLLDEDNNLYVTPALQATFRLAEDAAGYNVIFLD